MSIESDVYNYLKTQTAEAAAIRSDLDAVQADINSGRFTQETMRDEMYPRRDSLRVRLTSLVEETDRKARSLVSEYQDKLRKADCLNPEQINDDVKLLNAGITLLPRDIESLLERNKDNPTMTQIIIRFAREHDIECGAYYFGHEREIRDSENINAAISLYTSHWMKQPNASAMLDKFFCE